MYSLSHYSGQLLHFTSYLHGPTSYSSHYYGNQSAGDPGQHLPGVFVSFVLCLKHQGTGSQYKLT